jgi:hypothetical protein
MVEVGDVRNVDIQPGYAVSAMDGDGGFQVAKLAAERHLLFVGDELAGKHRDRDLVDGPV